MFPIQPVPIPRATRPLQPPPFKDASDIILAAAQLQNQRAGLQQKQVEDLSNTLMSAAGLMEHKRAAQASEAHANALLQLQQQQASAKMPEIEATVEKLKAEAGIANMITGSQNINPERTYAQNEKVDPNKPPTGVNPIMWADMADVHNGNSTWQQKAVAKGSMGAGMFIPMAQAMYSKFFPKDSQIQQAGALSQATGAGSAAGRLPFDPAIQQQIARANGILPDLNTIDRMSRLATPSDIKIINRVGLQAAAGAGNVFASNLLKKGADFQGEFSALYGAGSDMRAALGANVVNPTDSFDQIVNGTQIARGTIRSRRNAYMRIGNPTLPVDYQDPADTALAPQEKLSNFLQRAQQNGWSSADVGRLSRQMVTSGLMTDDLGQ